MSEKTYMADDGLVVPWRITDPLEGYEPRLGDPHINHRPYAHVGEIIELLTPEQLAALPDGSRLLSIRGEEVVKGVDDIDGDTRGGRLAYGLPDRRTKSEAPR